MATLKDVAALAHVDVCEGCDIFQGSHGFPPIPYDSSSIQVLQNVKKEISESFLQQPPENEAPRKLLYGMREESASCCSQCNTLFLCAQTIVQGFSFLEIHKIRTFVQFFASGMQ